MERKSNVKVDTKQYIGTYKDNWFGDVEIRISNQNELYFKSLRSPKLQGKMRLYDKHTFAIKWGGDHCVCDAFATFHFNDQKEPVKITMSGISPTIDFSYDFQDLELLRTN